MSSSSFPSPDGRPLTPQPRFWVEMLHRGFSAPRHFPWELKLQETQHHFLTVRGVACFRLSSS